MVVRSMTTLLGDTKACITSSLPLDNPFNPSKASTELTFALPSAFSLPT
jgi:hypothetical protein